MDLYLLPNSAVDVKGPDEAAVSPVNGVGRGEGHDEAAGEDDPFDADHR